MSASTAKRKPTPTPVSEWKQPQGVALKVPSGKTCLARRASIETFMQKGLIPNPLLKLVIESAQTGKPPSAIMAGVDQAQINSIFLMFDVATIHCVVEPKVHPTPPDHYLRDDEKLYVDEVDLEDKSFIFQWAVGGTADIEQFRAESRANVVTLSTSENVGVPSESTA